MAKINPKEVVVGLDVGRSGVKIAFLFNNQVKTHFIPSVVSPARKLTYDANPKVTRENTIEVDGEEFFIGETAIEQGASQTVGLVSNWLEGVEHKALLIRSKTYLKSYGVVPKMIVAGLPVNTFESSSELLFKQVKSVFNCAVLPVPQPWGVFQDCLLNDEGRYKPNGTSAAMKKFAVIDVGHFTTDILLMNNFQWIQESSGSSVGMYKAVSELQNKLNAQGTSTTLIECQEIMRTGKLKEFGETRDVSDLVKQSVPMTVSTVVQDVKNYIGNQARTIDHIIIAGGGSESVYNELKQIWRQCELAENARFSVAIGMRKFGISQALNDPSSIAD
ncbi:ParM/StbA family protein (plasmid) [Acinetobacter sp. SK-43]|uniref:ParM/StbA family protein n=1 Tax=Pseudomonadota TaxID=1224 RepID=UPI0012CE3BA6|nr:MULTISPECIES: ParM/StbA family protein [Pseudomonadota]MBF4453911.1 ParM/StbA family protein [Acinetobacter sp. SK-43]MPS92843.1 ParM/StbA family protein [Comamonas sp.]